MLEIQGVGAKLKLRPGFSCCEPLPMLHKSGRGDIIDEEDDEVDGERGKHYMVDVLYDVYKLIFLFFSAVIMLHKSGRGDTIDEEDDEVDGE
ncbi:hypothetical protein MTR_4g052600 [Medicago truncatula]|uniref:Uncharacterized protein n=1 Tax=Medicago truncatula TaxID=3880 RepID=A0A072UJB0_MEDTR|nr:hypothetical protein MTR_4g052600 [Medicago truncatula]